MKNSIPPWDFVHKVCSPPPPGILAKIPPLTKVVPLNVFSNKMCVPSKKPVFLIVLLSDIPSKILFFNLLFK